MSQKIKCLNEENVRLLCSFINKAFSKDEIIDDINIKSDGAFSSYYTTKLLQQLKSDNENYTNTVFGELTHLTCEETNILPTLDNTEVNTLYLYSATSTAPYQQYLKISDGTTEKLIDLGSTSITLSEYMKAIDIANTYTTKIETQAIVDTIGDKTDLETTAKDTLVSAINEIKEGLDDCITKENIVTTLDSTSTDTQVPSAKAVEERVKNMCTTTVADVDKVVIPLTSVTNYKVSESCECFYTVKNGICFVCLAVDCVTPQSDVFIGNVPAPTQVFRFSMARTDGAMHGYVLRNGELRLNGGTAGTNYYVTTFSYPVAE